MVAITVALFSLVLAIYVDDQFYTNRGPGFPITLIPFYDLGVALAPFGSPSAALSQSGIDNPTVLTFSLTLANAFIVSATVGITSMIMVRLGYRIPLSAVAALLLAFGTTFWSYASKSLFAEPLLAPFTIAAFHPVRCHRQSGSYWALLIAGVWVGWVDTHEDHGLCLGAMVGSICCLAQARLAMGNEASADALQPEAQ